MLYDAKLAQTMSRELYEEGVFAVGFSIRCSKGQARIRTQISAAHLETDLAEALKLSSRLVKTRNIEILIP